MRGLSKEFMDDLKDPNGLLHPIVERVKQDDTLMLAIRSDYINIYYRGGNILRIKKQSGRYSSEFDLNYNRSGMPCPVLPNIIGSQDDAKSWVNSLQALKGIMDVYFSQHPKPEREFQQVVARENNRSTIANATEFFITDIEFADSKYGARFDMLAVCWPATQRRNPESMRPALIEMKYGDDAIGGASGMLKHLQDIDNYLSDGNKKNELLDTMEEQFNQLDELGLLAFNRVAGWQKAALDRDTKPEVIFLLANHNPRSSRLRKILHDPQITRYANSKSFDLRFFVASFAGYALHRRCLKTLSQFRMMA